VASLNVGGLDLASTQPSDTDPDNYLISFLGPTGAILAIEFVGGVTPVGASPVPEPSAWLAFVIGAGVIAGMERRKLKAALRRGASRG
jgi:hypothetical protein